MTALLECGEFEARTDDDRLLFEGVSVSLAGGQCVCIEGASGSGKSTLLRQLTALAWTPGVNRKLDGKTYRGSELPAWRANVCLVAQDAPMLRDTVRENLTFPFRQRARQGRVFSEQEARQLLGGVGLGDLPLDRNVSLLSGGERHRLALVRGLLWNPRVLVADEVLSGLDPDAVQACFELLLSFSRQEDRLLICVLHDPSLCKNADRRLRLREGTLEES